MKNIKFKNFEIKSINENENELFIEGYGATFGNIDAANDIIEKGAFTKTISENKDRIAFCYQHDIYTPIGKIDDIKEDELGLYIKVRVSDSEDDIKTKIKEGILKEMSIGYTTIKSDYDSETKIRHIKEVKLWEISLVTIAMNPLAVITGLKSEEQIGYLEQEFDRIIAIETNKNKTFDLLKLKSLVFSLPQKAQEEEKPIEEGKKSMFANFTFE